jgi:hypothetical protein
MPAAGNADGMRGLSGTEYHPGKAVQLERGMNCGTAGLFGIEAAVLLSTEVGNPIMFRLKIGPAGLMAFNAPVPRQHATSRASS